jgi:hypothetical protein
VDIGMTFAVFAVPVQRTGAPGLHLRIEQNAQQFGRGFHAFLGEAGGKNINLRFRRFQINRFSPQFAIRTPVSRHPYRVHP